MPATAAIGYRALVAVDPASGHGFHSQSRITDRFAPQLRSQSAKRAPDADRKICAAHAPASGFPDAAAIVQPVEASVRIGLQRALERRQMPVRMLASMIRRVSEPDRRRR